MSEIIYTTSNELIINNPNQIELIKDQYLLLLSDLTTTNYIETELFIENIKKITNMGEIIIAITNSESGNFHIVASGTIIIEPKMIRDGKM